jgi:hypothetical protein
MHLEGISMATTAVSIDEYLSTAYEPDMDYVSTRAPHRRGSRVWSVAASAA